MNRKNRIIEKLKTLNPDFLEVIDQTTAHSGHAEILPDSEETHCYINISSKNLSKFKLIEQHRIINNLLKQEFDKGLHAISINIK